MMADTKKIWDSIAYRFVVSKMWNSKTGVLEDLDEFVPDIPENAAAQNDRNRIDTAGIIF